MRSTVTDEFWELFWKLPVDVRKQARSTYRLFQQNPFHPSLHFKQVIDDEPPVYSVRIGKGYRALAARETNDQVDWFWIGSHAEYDRLLKI